MIGQKGKQGEPKGLGYLRGQLWDSAKFMKGCLRERRAGGTDRKGASRVKSSLLNIFLTLYLCNLILCPMCVHMCVL